MAKSQAGDVPVQLVVLVEEAELAGGAVADGKAYLRGHRQEIVVAGVHPHAVGTLFGEPGFRLTVAPDLEHLEIHHVAVALAVLVAGREVAIDAAPYAVAFGAYGDVFGHLHAAVGEHGDVGMVGLDALLRRRRHSGDGQQQAGGEREQAVHAATRGAAREPSSASKNSDSPKPKERATTRSGKRWTASLFARTAPL